MAEQLRTQKCVPCEGGIAALTPAEAAKLSPQVPSWRLVNHHHLSRTFLFPDFVTALDFVNRVGLLAEQEGHHPNISFTWGRVTLDIWTHAADGLTENDFILASKVDALQS